MITAAADQNANVGGFLLTVLFVLFVGGGFVAGAIGFARFMTRDSDVHQHSGSFRHEHSGTIRHEVAGSVKHTVQHVGSVQHVHRLDQVDRERLDQLAAQRELEAQESARLEFAELQRKLDAVELRRQAAPRVIEVRPAIER